MCDQEWVWLLVVWVVRVCWCALVEFNMVLVCAVECLDALVVYAEYV